jgi:hypothetical protein
VFIAQIGGDVRASNLGRQSHQVVALAATGQLGVAAAGQIRLAVVSPVRLERSLFAEAARPGSCTESCTSGVAETDRA